MIDDHKISDANRLSGAAAQYADAGRDDRALSRSSDSSRSDMETDADHGQSGATLARLQRVLAGLQPEGGDAPVLSADQAALARAFEALVAAGVDRPPLPGSGRGATLARWRMLAAVASSDVALVKLYEGHTDALAILAELHGDMPPAGTRWAVWAAEPPNARVTAHSGSDGSLRPHHGDAVRLSGKKAWCSGAAHVTHALVTAWVNDQPCLVSVAMAQPGVTVTGDGWHARGMAATGSVDVLFEDAGGVLVGEPGAYLSRPGFWQGGAGIAACWMGAAAAIGRYTLSRLAAKARTPLSAPPTTRPSSPSSAQAVAPSAGIDAAAIDDLSALYAAELDLAMAAAATLLRETAAAIDAFPAADAREVAMRARLDIEALVDRVLRTAGRALGAAPLCRDAHFAALMTDLPVFLRQSHAERDLAAYGRVVLTTTGSANSPTDRPVPQRADHHATGESRWML